MVLEIFMFVEDALVDVFLDSFGFLVLPGVLRRFFLDGRRAFVFRFRGRHSFPVSLFPVGYEFVQFVPVFRDRKLNVVVQRRDYAVIQANFGSVAKP